MDIYGANKEILLNHSVDLYNEEIKFFKNAIEKYKLNDNYVLIAEPEQLMWIYAMTGFIKQNDTTKNILNQDKFNAIIYEYIDLMENTDYVIYFKNTLIYDVYSKILYRNAKVLYEDEIGGIIRKVN